MSRSGGHGWLGALAVLPILLTGCDVDVSVSGPTKAVPEKRLEKKISDLLTKQVGKRPNDIDCPRDLKAEVGQTMRCVLTADKARLGLTVTVESVQGAEVDFDVRVDEKPLPGSSGQ